MKLLQRLLVVAAMITVLEVIQKVSTLNRLLEIQDHRAAAEAGLLTPMMTRKPRVHNNTESSHHDINEAIPSTVTTVGNTRIPDETFLTTRRRRQQQQQQTEVQSAACQIPPLQGPEGSLGFQALTKIQLANNEEIRSKIICIVITDSTQHDTRLKAIVETYAPLCDGFLAASDQTDDSLGAVELFNKDQSAWERVTRTWSYVHQHYHNSFDAFHLAEDDTYLIPQNLRQLLSNYAGFYTQPLYLGGAVVPSRKTPEVRYCGGGAGYTLNRKALELVADGLGECSVIEKQQLPVDQQMAQCLNQLAHLQCGRTVDGESALRYLEFGIDYQANWSTKVQGSPIKAKPLKEYHKVYMRQGLGGIAADAVSIHLVNGNEPLTGFTPDYAIRRVHDILHGHCKSQWSQPALALEADGNSGYIHDPTFIRKNPLPFTTHPAGDRQGVCDPAFGSGIEGKDGYIGLQKIRIMPEEATNPKKLLCIVYTHSGRHDRVRSIAETYGPRCDGFMAASNLTDPSIGAVNLLHEGPEEYDNMWLKVRAIWQYIYDHYREDYDYFHIGGDDMFVIPENLRHVASTSSWNGPSDQSLPLFFGGNMVDFPHTHIRYCGGGSGYSMNRVALELLIEKLFDTHHCRPHYRASAEDRIISQCFRSVGIDCLDTNDEASESRYHQASANFHATWKHQYPSVWRADSLEKVHGILSKEELGQISETSISFHLKGKRKGVEDRGMRRYHAILHGICKK